MGCDYYATEDGEFILSVNVWRDGKPVETRTVKIPVEEGDKLYLDANNGEGVRGR